MPAAAPVPGQASFKTAIPSEVLRRHGYPERKPKATVNDILTASQEASRCLLCGCGEGCGLCKQICCDVAPTISRPDTIEINEEACVACGMCFHRCPNKNIQMVAVP
jgi:Na+-translocating ferredoxin:NAD+ oxidoreductase RNF subunit RnfB